MSHSSPPALVVSSSWQNEGQWEMERELELHIEALHNEMLEAKSDLAELIQKGDEEGFIAALPAFLTMSFAWLDGAAIERLHRDDYHHEDSLVEFCVGHGRVQALSALLQAGANPRGNSRSERASAIHQVAAATHKRAAQCAVVLLEAGVSVDELTSQGDSPLILAARHDNAEMVAFFLGQGASVELRNKRGRSAEEEALYSKSLEAAGILAAWREAQELRASMPPASLTEAPGQTPGPGRPRI